MVLAGELYDSFLLKVILLSVSVVTILEDLHLFMLINLPSLKIGKRLELFTIALGVSLTVECITIAKCHKNDHFFRNL